MTALRIRLLRQMTKAEKGHDARAVVLIARETIRVSEIIGRLSGQIGPAGALVQAGVFSNGSTETVRERVLSKLAALAGPVRVIEVT